MSSKPKKENDATVFNEADLWISEEKSKLVEKETELSNRQSLIAEKIEALDQLSGTNKLTKAKRKIKSMILKPSKRRLRLQAIGDDLIKALSERLAKYRIQRILSSYESELKKFNEAKVDAELTNDKFPELSSLIGGLDFEEVPEFRNDEGAFVIVSSSTEHVIAQSVVFGEKQGTE